MSIINDALKKAKRESLLRSEPEPEPQVEAQDQPQPESQIEVQSQPPSPLLKKEISQSKSRRYKPILPLIGAVSAVFLLLFFLNNFLPKKDAPRGTNAGKKRPRKSALSKLIQAKNARATAGLSLSGIVSSEGDFWAIINDRIVRVGDTIGKAKLLAIKDNSVELSLADKKLILDLKE